MASTEPPQPAAADANTKMDADIRKFLSDQKHERGIPTVVFIDDVDKFLEEKKVTVEVVIGAFTELIQKFGVMLDSLNTKKANLKMKLPEVENTLDLVRVLKDKQDSEEEMLTHYALSDVIFAKAKVNCNGTVCLWLGANVMVEYSYDEAIEMLEKSVETNRTVLSQTRDDIGFVQTQKTTLEVNMARVFNHDVMTRRKAKEAAEEKK